MWCTSLRETDRSFTPSHVSTLFHPFPFLSVRRLYVLKPPPLLCDTYVCVCGQVQTSTINFVCCKRVGVSFVFAELCGGHAGGGGGGGVAKLSMTLDVK